MPVVVYTPGTSTDGPRLRSRPPHAASMVGWFQTWKGTLADRCENHASGLLLNPARPVLTYRPEVEDGYIITGNSDAGNSGTAARGLDTRNALTSAFTMLVVARAPGPLDGAFVRPMFIGDIAFAQENAGSGIWIASSTGLQGRTMVTSSVDGSPVGITRSLSPGTAALNDWGMYAYTVSPTSHRLFDLTRDEASASQNITTTRVLTSRFCRVGLPYDQTGNRGLGHIAFAGLWSAALTQEQLGDIATFLRAIMPSAITA